ncbi:MAG: hypothetical protein ACFFDT_20130 [Candidatus Hodarchaeota archaeon]
MKLRFVLRHIEYMFSGLGKVQYYDSFIEGILKLWQFDKESEEFMEIDWKFEDEGEEPEDSSDDEDGDSRDGNQDGEGSGDGEESAKD